ncbi:hypothetical protein [Pelagibacterium sp.]|uniref:hypothetical protein n=1 Tax=Pelagibacterium sp. TaxID=1967288 RepID=UPI003BA95F17
MSMVEKMQEIFGERGMKSAPSRAELYRAIDLLSEAVRDHKQRLDAIEGIKGAKSQD